MAPAVGSSMPRPVRPRTMPPRSSPTTTGTRGRRPFESSGPASPASTRRISDQYTRPSAGLGPAVPTGSGRPRCPRVVRRGAAGSRRCGLHRRRGLHRGRADRGRGWRGLGRLRAVHRLAEVANRSSQRGPGLRQLARTDDQQGDHEDDDQVDRGESAHRWISRLRGLSRAERYARTVAASTLLPLAGRGDAFLSDPARRPRFAVGPGAARATPGPTMAAARKPRRVTARGQFKVAGRVASVIWMVRSDVPRRTVRVTVEPGAWAARSSTSGWFVSTFVPSSAVMMSFSRRPAAAAGLPAWTAAVVPLDVIHAPASTDRWFRDASPALSDWYTIPTHGRTSFWPASACSVSGRATLIGIAKPIPWADPAIAVSIPMTAPLTSTRGPPLLPGLMAASVWIRSSSRLVVSEIERSTPETTPVVTVPGYWPSGSPTAMAVCPICRVDESPSVAVGRAVAAIFTIARSVSVSVP